MKSEALLTPDQQDAIDRLYNYDQTLLLGGMGAGKTVIVLSALSEMLAAGLLDRILIIAPLKVCDTVWRHEAGGWQHLSHLNVDVAIGTPAKRKQAFEKMGKLVVTNYENLAWVKKQGYLDGFDGLVIDESTKLKSHGAWFKALRWSLKGFKWRVAMTGTLLSENIEQVFYQAFLVDNGAALGKNREKFLREYFYPTDFQQRNWAAFPGALEQITARLADVLYEIPDYTASLPKLTVQNINVKMGKTARHSYKEMADGFEAEGVLAETAAAKSLKLEQLANGFIYDEDKVAIPVHSHKIAALKQHRKNRENGSSLLLIYQFIEDLEQIKAVYPDVVCLNDSPDVVDRWNRGEVEVMAMHPKSGGHGLNLAAGGWSMLWFSPVWSADATAQTIARLWRRGQAHEVVVDVLVCEGTVDQVKIDRVEGKGEFMPLFLAHLAAIRGE